jgi:hypothetical protein
MICISQTATLETESEILELVIEYDTAGMSPEAAQALLRFRFNTGAVARMNELAEKNREGAIAPSERALLERYVRVGNFLNLIHAKARCAERAVQRLRADVWDRVEGRFLREHESLLRPYRAGSGPDDKFPRRCPGLVFQAPSGHGWHVARLYRMNGT